VRDIKFSLAIPGNACSHVGARDFSQEANACPLFVTSETEGNDDMQITRCNRNTNQPLAFATKLIRLELGELGQLDSSSNGLRGEGGAKIHPIG